MRIAVLDDYQNVALDFADWSAIKEKTEVTVFNKPATIDELMPFDVLCMMRERMPFNREQLSKLGNLNLTEEKAHRAGAELVSKEYLFKNADFVTEHLVLSERSRNTIGEATYRVFYGDIVKAITTWLEQHEN